MKTRFLLLGFLLLSSLCFAQNHALDFDGTDDYVEIPHSSSLLIGSSPLTLECWINAPNTDQEGSFIAKRQPNNPWGRASLSINDGTDPRFSPSPGKKITLSFGDAAAGGDFRSVTTVNDIIDGNYHHIAATVEPSTESILLYVDGTLQTVTTLSTGPFPTVDNTEPYMLGQANGNVSFYTGLIDEVRIWNIVRTAAEIQANMNIELTGTEPGLVAYYPLNQGIACGDNATETIAFDQTANNNDGTLINFALNGGCTSNWTDNAPFTATDNDGDGVTVENGDCDDNNPNIYPGNTEITCNGIDDDCDPNTPDQVTHPDFAALEALYNATNGANWNNTWDLTDCDVCGYYGIVCDGITGLVEIIDLNNNNLTGMLPPELGDMQKLTFLYLQDNQLSGSIPGNIGNAPDLRRLHLSNNALTGPIPPELGTPNLLSLALDNNQLSGPIPSELANLSGSANQLSFQNNQLCGCFPEVLRGIGGICNNGADFSNNPGLYQGGNFAAFCVDGSGSCDSNPPGSEITCNEIDDDCDPSTPDAPEGDSDNDGDGFTTCTGDCDDTNPAINPDATEITCNGIDDDCDPTTPDTPDFDGDGVPDCDDCNPTNAAVYPGNTEITCNGIDDDCDPNTPDAPDNDGDGSSACDDCDDNNPNIYPGATEITCNDIDDDCDPNTPDAPDNDGDGSSACDDCDDNNPNIYPGATEITCNNIDDDCDPNTPDAPDNDGDGSSACDDCDDNNPNIYPGASEISCNDIDDDCNPNTPDAPDNDGDGSSTCDDCDDNNPNIYPGATEITCNGIDDDCNPNTPDAPDNDGDGSSACDDCDDNNPNIYPGATEICNDVDDNCDGFIDEDLNCDGNNCEFTGEPGQTDSDCDGILDECDLCNGGDDSIDNDENGVPDCAEYPGQDLMPEEWICGNNDNKVYICHDGNTICVHPNSLPDHLAHGDYIGPCDNASCEEQLRLVPADPTADDNLMVYPNPVTGVLQIRWTGTPHQPATHLEIFGIHENKVLQRVLTSADTTKRSMELDVSTWPEGVYFIVLWKGQERTFTRFIKISP